MKNINLKNEDLKNQKRGSGNLSTTLSLILISTLLVVYGAIFYLNSFVERKTNKIQDEIIILQNTLSQKEYQEAYNFGVMVINLKNKIGNRDFLPQTQNIIKISEKTFKGVAYTSLSAKSEGNFSSYAAEVIPENPETLAKQINIYKKVDNFNNVILNSFKEGEKKSISASINFNIGKKEEIKTDQTEASLSEEENF